MRTMNPSWPAERETMRMPATHASIEPTAQAKAATRLALMPSSRDVSRESAVARMAMPRLVNLKNQLKNTAMATATTPMTMSSLANRTPPRLW